MTAPETLATPGRMRNSGRERKRGRIHPDSERIPSTPRRTRIRVGTNPIIGENNRDRSRGRSSLIGRVVSCVRGNLRAHRKSRAIRASLIPMHIGKKPRRSPVARRNRIMCNAIDSSSSFSNRHSRGYRERVPATRNADFSVSRELAKYRRTEAESSGAGRLEFTVATEVSRNESIYLRVVGFRESMHDDYEPPSPIPRLTPLFF